MTPRQVTKIPIEWTNVGGGVGWQSQPIPVTNYRNIDLTIVGTGTVQVYGSADLKKDASAIDFTVASTIDNSYGTMVIADLTTPATYATSLIVANATKIGEVNTNVLTWICLTRSVDTVDAFITVSDNL